MEDPRRLAMGTGSRAAPVHIVEATSIPLSERFGKVPCHNPLRPNPNVGVPRDRERSGFQDDFFQTSEDKPRPLFGGNAGNGNRRLADTLDLSPGVNKLAVLRAAKDAEILRLRAKLQNAQRQLRSGGGGGGRNGNGNGGLRTIQKNGGLIFKNRVGGGVLAGHGGGKQQLVHLTSEAALELLQSKRSQIGVSPLKRNGKGKKGYSANFFDEPRSKAELDDELDAYMSKRKGKGSLDKELDNYMSVARSKYLAARAKAVADGAQINETPQPASDADKEMDTTTESEDAVDSAAANIKRMEEELAAMEADDDL